MKSKLPLAALLLFILFSCDQNHNIQTLKLEDLMKTWKLMKFIDKNTLAEDSLPNEYSATISFKSNYTIDVHGPCNSGSGKFTINRNQVFITQLAMTERACNALNRENKFTSNLSGIYSIEGNMLIIQSDFDTDLVFIKLK